MIDTIETIRYMGVKSALLEHIIPCIESITPSGGKILDIMAGTNSVAYALKRYYTIYTNDVQEYSRIISNALIVNQQETINEEYAKNELLKYYKENLIKKFFVFFEKTYSDTYFSKEQCIDIDSLRYAIEQVKNNERKNLYLLALMSAMCKVQSTPGHFAQFMPSNHARIIPLQKKSLLEEFLEKCNNYNKLVFTKARNRAFCSDFNDLILESDEIKDVNTIYLDSPYSQEQYSRFYHILETVVKYDSPDVSFKAKYRNDRFMSNFCYKNKVSKEFEKIVLFCVKHKINLVISYSTNGVMSSDSLIELCKKHFNNVEVKYIDFIHSTQGKGSNKVKEIIITSSFN